jgi:hypothetical protein
MSTLGMPPNFSTSLVIWNPDTPKSKAFCTLDSELENTTTPMPVLESDWLDKLTRIAVDAKE